MTSSKFQDVAPLPATQEVTPLAISMTQRATDPITTRQDVTSDTVIRVVVPGLPGRQDV